MLKLATKLAPQPDALQTAHRAGFRNAELWLDEKILADWQTAARHARQYPNEYVLHFPNRLQQAGNTLRQTVELYRALGCRCLVIHQPMFDRYAQDLLKLEPALRLAIENHKLTPEQLTQWADASPGLTLDVEHVWKFTLRDAPLGELLDHLRGLLRRCGDKLRHVHLPGYWPGLDEHRPMYCSREMVFPVLTLLAEIDFDGLIVSEVDTAFQNDEELRMDVLLFDRWRALHDPLFPTK